MRDGRIIKLQTAICFHLTWWFVFSKVAGFGQLSIAKSICVNMRFTDFYPQISQIKNLRQPVKSADSKPHYPYVHNFKHWE
jgi:hypothetical protein